MNVANKAIIRKLTIRSLKANKRRNFFIVAAVVLTVFMITSVFSVGISYYETMMVTPLLSEGMRTHAGKTNANSNQIEAMRSLNYVKRISIGYRVGMGYTESDANGIALVALNEESWRYFQTPAFTDIVGKYAKAENEIMLSRALLDYMGIDEPYIGMEIPIDYAIGDFLTNEYGERQSGVFVLSAIFTEYVSTLPGRMHTPIFVSEAFAERHGRHNTENANINIIFTNQSRAVEYAKRLARDLTLDYGSEVIVHPSLVNQTDRGSSTMYIAIGIIVAFFMFVGFLLIYNVMYISVSKDVRFYGLLKTMGTTPKQLRRIVNGQVFMLYFIGLPIGLAAAALVSFSAVPALITASYGAVVSFSPLIYAGGAVFALITAYLGASISAKKAAKVSPIEALRYAGEQSINLKPRSPANGKPSRMAWRNMFRERRRAFIVMLSLFLGITVFTGAMAVVNSMDIEGHIEFGHDHDIEITATDTGLDKDLGLIGMDRGFIEEIANVPGVKEVRERTLSIAMVDFPQEVASAIESSMGIYLPFAAITGVDKAFIEDLNAKTETPIDIEAFERGEIVIIVESDSAYMGELLYEYYPIGAKLTLEMGQQSRIPVNTEIGGYINRLRSSTGTYGSIASGMGLVMSNTFLDSISAKAGVLHLGINIEEGKDELVNAAISEVVKANSMSMGSAFEARRQQEEARVTMLVLGATISVILALIGIFNFINLISVGILSRKRELATLESVGMTSKQMRLMLRWEGAIYWIATIAASVTAGSAGAYGLFRLIKNQDALLFPQFIYPVLPVAVVFALIVLICTATPEVCYRGISKNTLVERLREVE